VTSTCAIVRNKPGHPHSTSRFTACAEVPALTAWLALSPHELVVSERISMAMTHALAHTDEVFVCNISLLLCSSHGVFRNLSLLLCSTHGLFRNLSLLLCSTHGLFRNLSLLLCSTRGLFR
jgi:hypothetical protein